MRTASISRSEIRSSGPFLDALFAALPHERGLLGVLALEELHVGKPVPEPRRVGRDGGAERDERQSGELSLAHEPTVW
jgi:hypothetical protein